MRKLTTLMLALLFMGSIGAAAATNINIQKIRTEPVPLQTAEYADIWFRVVNNGSSAAEDLQVNFTPTFPFNVDPDEKTTWDIGRLSSAEQYYIHLQTKVDENAVYGTNQLRFTVDRGDGPTFSHTIPVEVRNDESVLAIDEIRFPDTVAAGQQAEMTLELHNYADSQLNNVEVELDLTDLPVATADTARNTITSLAPGASAETSFTLTVDQDADNGVQKIPISLNYENEAGTGFETTTTTGLVIGGEPRLELGINQQDIQVAGSAGTTTLRIVNRGDGTARFVNLEILEVEGAELLSRDSTYLGNMDPDDYQTAELRMYADSGTDRLLIRGNLSYKSSGETRSMVQEIPVRLYSPETAQQYGLIGSGSSLPLIAVVAVLVIAGVIYWRRRR